MAAFLVVAIPWRGHHDLVDEYRFVPAIVQRDDARFELCRGHELQARR